MGEDVERILQRRLSRGGFLKIGAVAAGASVLAACGSGDDEEAAAPPPAEPAEPAGASPEPAPPAAPTPPPIEDESNGELEVFEWAGYEYPTYGGEGDTGVLQPYVDTLGPPKYTFLTSDDQALGKVRAGFAPDIVHPCVDYLGQWQELGVIQPWDTSLLTNWANALPSLVQGGQIDGQQYFIPVDWGFSSPLYRADKVEPQGEESWTLFYDDRYEGKISWWDSPLENFVIWGYVNGVSDPWNMTDAELDEARDFLVSKKGLVRNFWASQTDLDADIAAGNVWIAYAWGGSYTAAKDAGLDVVYSRPKEGRLAWNCGFILLNDSDQYYHAHEYVDDWLSPASAEWMISNYAYGHVNTSVDLTKIDPQLVEVFSLDDPAGTQEPNAHYARPVPSDRRREYAKRWDEVKAA
jgi:spermidine/putrescine-binding protein